MIKGRYVVIGILVILASVMVYADTNEVMDPPTGWEGFAWIGQHDAWCDGIMGCNVWGKTRYIKICNTDECTRMYASKVHGTAKDVDKIRIYADTDKKTGNRADISVYNQNNEFLIANEFLMDHTTADYCGYQGSWRQCHWEFDVNVPEEITGIKISNPPDDYFGMHYKSIVCPDADGDGFLDINCGGDDCNDADSEIYPSAFEVCDDEKDNDCDGLVDCDDDDCVDAPICVVIPPENCTNNIDDDSDGLIDCDDNDCVDEPACVIIEINLTSAYWTDKDDVEIQKAGVGQEVKLVAEGQPENAEVKFEVWDKTLIGKVPIRTDEKALYANITGGKTIANMTITQEDYNNGWGVREFYFEAFLVTEPDITAESDVIEVISGCIPLSCEKIAENEDVDEICRKWPDGCGGSIDCDGCTESATCDKDIDETEGRCIITEDVVVYCEDYTNQENCTNYYEEIAIRTGEKRGKEVYGIDSGFCESPSAYQPDPDCNYNITCICEWYDEGCKGAEEIDKNCELPEPDSFGICHYLSNIINECDESPKGQRAINSTRIWEQILGSEGESDCFGSELITQKCLSRVMLDFFNTFNLVIAILVIIVFYYLVLRKKKKRL